MLSFKNVYINDWYSVVGPLGKDSNLKHYDLTMDDYYFGEKTFEKAEIKMQNVVLDYLNKKNKPELVIGSDLLNQLVITNMSMENRKIPYIGIYSACASSIAGLILLSNLIDSKNINSGTFITSSHNLTAEKQFRFPIEYGAPKPIRSTFTATGSIGVNLSNTKSNIKIINGTIGNVVNSDVKDVYNMGAVMARGAIDTLLKHLKETKTTIDDYDLVLTGDLGEVGGNIFKQLLTYNNIKAKKYLDAGTFIYHNAEYSGASGPAVLLLVLFNNIIYTNKYHKILLIATGSLHSPLLINQKNTIPTVAHALTIEVIK